MPSVNDMMQIAEALEKSPIAVVRDRCLAVRNRNSTCRRCMGACPVDAIDVCANTITLDAGTCIGCGACAVVCPSEALLPVQPSEPDLARNAAEATAENDGMAVFACARISSKHQAEPSLYAEVPCLARVDESLLANLVAHGATSVMFVDGCCDTCKFRDVVPCIDATVGYANEILAVQGSDVRVMRASAFPEHMAIDDDTNKFGATRRAFFSEAAGAARETAMTAARTTVGKELGLKAEEEPIGVRLRVMENGAMPRLEMPRHDALINAMDAIGAPVVSELESRRFGSVEIDLSKCNACGMCVVFCPSGALERDAVNSASKPLRYIEFSAASCVQCGLCEDVCWKKALTMSSTVSTDQLFDFEPRTFWVSR